ncbi:MAG TPA: hypothetical protein VMU05_04395 [Dongiaceae bacterium]|nr:hypothetical protein [Dongiaceae bacterium]
MSDFGVLNNRKRAIVALIHSVVFLGVAFQGFLSPKVGILHGVRLLGDVILIAIYLIVTSILCWLVSISRGRMEKIYFALCATSASCGLLRTICGDQVVPPAQYLRVVMLTSAVAVGVLIVRAHSRTANVTDSALPSEVSQD